MDTTPTQNDDADALAGDLLKGATRIAAFISTLIDEPVTEDEVYYGKKTGKWPIGKHGAELIASKRRLTKHAHKLARGTTAA